MRSGLTTVPLQSRPNASPFWIMLLLSSTAFGHGMIETHEYCALAAYTPGVGEGRAATTIHPTIWDHHRHTNLSGLHHKYARI